MDRLKKIIKLEGTMKVITGLHIGAGNDEIKIGGIDTPVVRDPVTNEPYIPGSSIKGKMRFLLEWYLGKVDTEKGDVFKDVNDSSEEAKAILKIFGLSGDSKVSIGPTRASFYDIFLTDESKALLKEKVGSLMTEDKTEVRINRIKGTGEHPRHTERIPAGAEFAFKLVYKVFDDEDEKLFTYILKGLKLIEFDGLGGSVSRGYGKVKFENLKKTVFEKGKEADSKDITEEFETMGL
ncbi:type III-A CRISPR-associated RAMP protein Csm3 [Desulfurobacterium atlanticum]|uniref:CRISPR system Cms endoribonuclease Csm3 n=1 Tax=Desulfurobacterium atlanticum TaxID=240169 RepID=A0A238Y3I2_9BACT|nr:type III-A CRISPR-associated RAMP protein Csm3 [Desulfurobacterium atlanticum]SNR65836.1 CRISPR-associated protein, Csm3 family [Desulfurobacterium atlanticum]